MYLCVDNSFNVDLKLILETNTTKQNFKKIQNIEK